MAGLSDSAEDAALDHILGTALWTFVTQKYIGLYIAAPSDAGGGTEVSGNGYARQAINFAAASGGEAVSSDAPAFAASGGNWGTVTHFGIFDAVSGGNLIAWAALDVGRLVNNGDTLTFAIGDVVVTLD